MSREQRVSVIEMAAGDDVRDRLGALSLLMFAVPEDHAAYEQSRRLDAHLRPVREAAKKALQSAPRGAPTTPAQRAALARCWELIEEAGLVIDAESFLLIPGDTTVKWAMRHVDRLLEAKARLVPPGAR